MLSSDELIAHSDKCEAWIKEAAADLSMTEDHVAWDIIQAYAYSELNSESDRRQFCRMKGVEWHPIG